MTQYPNEQYRQDFQSGLEFQDFVAQQFARLNIPIQYFQSRKFQYEVGESAQGIEVKLDRRCTETKRLSIETAAKTDVRRTTWTPGGIYRADNTWLYVQGNYDVLFVFAKTTLIRLHQSKKFSEYETATIRKFYLTFSQAKEYAALVMDFSTPAEPNPFTQYLPLKRTP